MMARVCIPMVPEAPTNWKAREKYNAPQIICFIKIHEKISMKSKNVYIICFTNN